MLTDQDLSTYGVIQNLAWGGSVPSLAEQLGWDAQAVVSRVREGEMPKEPVRVFRVTGQMMFDGALECDPELLEALGAGIDSALSAALLMFGEVLRRTLEVQTAQAPEDKTQLHGDWVQTAVRVLWGEASHEIRQYMRPTDVQEAVKIFSAADEEAEEGGEEGAADIAEVEEGGEEPGNAPGAQPSAEPAPPERRETPDPGAPPDVSFRLQQWPQAPEEPGGGDAAAHGSLELLFDVPLTVRAELGRTTRKVEEIIGFGPGSVVDLDRMVGDMVDLYANGQWVARGEVVVVEENFGVRITEIGSASERAQRLRMREGS